MFENISRLDSRDGRVCEVTDIARNDEIKRFSKGTRNDNIVLYIITGKRESILDDEPINRAHLKVRQTVFKGRFRQSVPYLFATNVIDVSQR